MELSTGAALAFTICMAAVYLIEAVMKPFVLAHGLTTPTLVIFIGVIGGIIAHGIPACSPGRSCWRSPGNSPSLDLRARDRPRLLAPASSPSASSPPA